MFAQDYRPKKFSEVAGQETAVATLKSIAMTDKFPVRALLLQGAYGTGKCVPAGTRVITQKGYQPIETLFEDPEEGFNDADFTVNTRQGKAKATKFYYERLAEVLTVTTKNGRTIRGTAKHRVMAEYAENLQDEIVEVASPSVAALRMARALGTTYTLPSISEPIRIKEFGQAWPIEGITHNLSVDESMTIGSSEKVRLLNPHLKQDLFPLGLMNKGFTVLFSTTPQEFGEHNPQEAWTCGAIMGSGGRHHSGPEFYFMGTKEMCQTFAIKAGWHGPLVHTLKWSGTYHYGISPSKDDVVDVQLPYAFEGDVIPATMNWDIESRWEFLEGLRFSGILKVIAGKFLINTRSKLVADTVFEVLTTVGRPPIRYELDSNSGKIYIVEADRVSEVPSILVSLSEFEPNHSPYTEEYLRDEVETITTTNESVYDLTVPGVEEFYAQGTYNHNTTLSRLFAKAVNCEQFKKTGEVCNECAGCLEAERSGSLTYREYDATRVGNVDAIKSLLDSLQIKNFDGRRVITVDEVHTCLDYRTPLMTTNGAIEIKDLVNSADDYSVESVNYETGEVQVKKVIGKYDNGQDDLCKWYRIQWDGGVARVTENHTFFKNGVKVQAKDLKSGDKLDSVQWAISPEAEQVMIGTLLGDSIVLKDNREKVDSARSRCQRFANGKSAILQMAQGVDQLDYLRWKASFFGSLVGKEGVARNGRIYRYSFKVREVENYRGPHSSADGFKGLNREILEKMGPLAWLCWYLDDGHYNKRGFIEISCTNLGVEGANLVKEFCAEKFGWNLHVYSHAEKRSNKLYVKLRWHKDDSRSFFDFVKGLIDIECINYKVPAEYRGTITPRAPKRELVRESLEIQIREFEKEEWITGGKKSDWFRRFNIEVEDNHNYTLPGGLLTSNCSRQAQSALLKVLEEGIPDTIFVFATTDAVLKTIESRSVKLDFFQLPKDVIIKRLKDVVAIEGIDITEDQLNAIAFKSQGHMRNALSVLEHFSIAGDEAIRTPQSDVKQYFLNCLKKQPTDDVILRIMQYPLLDVQAAIRDFIVNCFKVTEGLEGRIRQKGLSFQIFKYFYTPEAQQAFHDEVGMEILLRAFAEQLSR